MGASRGRLSLCDGGPWSEQGFYSECPSAKISQNISCLVRSAGRAEFQRLWIRSNRIESERGRVGICTRVHEPIEFKRGSRRCRARFHASADGWRR
jgi:hypothetical protein